MATYKLIQDIEAEDHILGPLTLRQFIYALIAVFFLYLCFIVISKGVLFLLLFFLPPGLFFLFFAFPFRKDQPNEIWALAKIRFLFKSRVRIWDQSGAKELVNITAPKRVETHLTNGLSQSEVKNRLHALADTIDSRGWVIKNIAVNSGTTFGYGNIDDTNDRLLNISSMPRPVPDYDIIPSEDILDENQNPLAQQLGRMIDRSTVERRRKLVASLNSTITDQQLPTVVLNPNIASNTNNEADETTISSVLRSQSMVGSWSNANLQTIKPEVVEITAPTKPAIPVQSSHDIAILNLAGDNNRSIMSLSTEAKKAKVLEDEVVVDLHQ